MDTYALHEAVKRGSLDDLNEALDGGADVLARLPTGETALHLAVAARRPDLVCALLFAGSDVQARDAFGRTPLDLDGWLNNG